MRFTAIGAAGALLLLSVSTSLMAQRADNQIDPRSVELVRQGRAALAAGNFEGAGDALESALAVDPRNREAYLVLAEIARKNSLPGKAIRLYREALSLEPNDTAALRGQGEAMVAKGAMERAKENLAKIEKLCAKGCADATQLSAAIAKGPPVTTAQAEPAPTPSATPTAKP
ncbi:tetratricopeptide repeat protein [Sphingomonas sp. NPDC092331]|uniref:tetratricopeptide repeat protein n=1 Tax=unclassified Sphingomonas TaxID=196159 RepID=UPI0029EB9E97|nr:tetratricopeptide repeat protein [Pseudomonadota bacterium]